MNVKGLLGEQRDCYVEQAYLPGDGRRTTANMSGSQRDSAEIETPVSS